MGIPAKISRKLILQGQVSHLPLFLRLSSPRLACRLLRHHRFEHLIWPGWPDTEFKARMCHSLPSSVPPCLDGQGQPSGHSLLPKALGTAGMNAATFPKDC